MSSNNKRQTTSHSERVSPPSTGPPRTAVLCAACQRSAPIPKRRLMFPTPPPYPQERHFQQRTSPSPSHLDEKRC